MNCSCKLYTKIVSSPGLTLKPPFGFVEAAILFMWSAQRFLSAYSLMCHDNLLAREGTIK